MRNQVASFAFATAATLLLPPGARASRPCSDPSETFQYRLGDVRYDGPDPSKDNGLSTIAASLQSSTQTPLYECVAQWPEEWAGWYEGGNNPVWGDCIWTGAGAGQDDTVSFAVDWKTKTLYVALTFSCSDMEGYVLCPPSLSLPSSSFSFPRHFSSASFTCNLVNQANPNRIWPRYRSHGLSTGAINLDFNCTTADGSSFCVPKTTDAGTRPELNIVTELVPAPVNATSPCAADSQPYQSWKVENWQREIEMEPGNSPTDPKLISDTGPSFSLRSMVNGDLFNCTQSEANAGTCESSDAAEGTTVDFLFDPKLNMLKISQHSQCDES